MSRIESLTDAQVARLDEWRDKWLGIGLSTAPADRAEAERGVDLAYRAAGLEPPRIRIWLRSPIEGIIGAAYLAEVSRQAKEKPEAAQAFAARNFGEPMGAQVGAQVRAHVWDQVGAQVRAHVWDQVGDQVWAHVWDQVGDQVRAQVRAQVGDQVWAQVWDQVRAQVGAQVRAHVWDQVGAQVRAHVWDQVGDQVRAQVRAQVGDQVRAQVWDQVRDQVRAQVGAQVRAHVWDQVGDQVWAHVGAQYSNVIIGQHDAGWASFYDFFGSVCGLAAVDRLAGLIAVARSSGWWWPMHGAVVLTERPQRLTRDQRGRLHCEDRAAIEYPDGWGVYAWHGVRVPERVIKQPESITLQDIDREANAEIRRVMTERYGVERYLVDAGAKLLHEDTDDLGFQRRLVRKERAGDLPMLAVFVMNSTLEPDGTRKQYMLRVHPELRPLLGRDASGVDRFGETQKMTCHNAVASTFGLRGEEYHPEIQT